MSPGPVRPSEAAATAYRAIRMALLKSDGSPQQAGDPNVGVDHEMHKSLRFALAPYFVDDLVDLVQQERFALWSLGDDLAHWRWGDTLQVQGGPPRPR